MSELGSSGGLLGYAVLLWAALPDETIARVAGAASGVPDEATEPGAPIPAPRAAGRRRIEA
jgi:hypothetical protein